MAVTRAIHIDCSVGVRHLKMKMNAKFSVLLPMLTLAFSSVHAQKRPTLKACNRFKACETPEGDVVFIQGKLELNPHEG
jgi:hypothetical protein